ncbi:MULTISPECIES: hypothetical protein [unclassified Acinetobacter]|uniref:hypothetical protein n=1 Tax=Acinetobacter TaxID=469 RepID=UPI0015D16786|nr:MULTISPECIES: hypothetical protein [unclassified Acinetobacter]
MSKAVERLETALQRLIDGKPLKVEHPYKINNDTVALEAGLKRGSVNKQRSELADLLIKIKEAEDIRTGKSTEKGITAKKKEQKKSQADKINELNQELNELKQKYMITLSENNSLIYHNHLLHKRLKEAKQALDTYVVKFNKSEK